MSAAERVAHAAATIRARWERGVTTDPQTEAAQALETRGLLQSTETAAELERLRAERESSRVDGQRLIRAEQRRAELEAVLGGHREEDRAEITRLRARVAELEAEQGNNDGAKAPWGRAEDGRPYLPEGAHWTDVPELVDRTVAGIQARVDQAQPGHWYAAPATETGLAPGTVRTRVEGYPRAVGQFTNVLPADLELILHAREDLSWCLEMLAKFRTRVAELETSSQVLPLVVDVPVPVVLTEADGPVVANNASARAATGGLRRLLHPLDPGVRS